MADINEPSFQYNIGGYNTVSFIESFYVNSLPLPVDHTIDESSIVLASGKQWNNFYGTPKTILPDIKSTVEDGGIKWDVMLSLRYPYEQAATTKVFLGMLQKPYFIKLTDNNGEKRLFGYVDFPLRQLFGLLNPGEVAGYNGYEVKFAGSFAQPPYYLV